MITSANMESAVSTAVIPSSSSYGVVNVKSHIPISLEFSASNYSRWSQYFKTLCGKFGLLHHIDGTVARPGDAAWVRADYVVLSWLHNSISDEVLDVAMEPDQCAHDLWTLVDNNFNSNKEPCAIYLSSQFHSLMQGDSPVSTYCQKMKKLVDALRDIGHPVSESQLVLNLLRGLAPRLSHQADILASKDPFPDFASA